MKNKKGLSISKVTKYLPVLIILLSITIIIGSTFAYFTDTKEKESGLTFSKVELSNESNVGVNGTIKDVIPGSPLIVNPVQFSKGIDSEAIYVRAKLSFSLPRAYESDSKMLDLLDDIRNSTSFNIHSDEQNGAVWSSKQGNYYYLVLKDDNTLLKRVDTIDTYTLSNEIVVPRDLESLEDNYQYMKSINFHIAFEAIQADNVSNVLSETKETFNVTFPEAENEKFVQSFNLVFKGIDLTTTYEEVKVRAGEVTVEIEPPTHTNPKAQFVGWYSDSTFENQFTFGTTIEQNYTLYPKFSAGEKLTIMDTDNTTVLEEIMVEDGSYSTEPTLLQLPADANGTHTKAVEGWYTESSYQNKFVFGTEISESTTLYPKLVDVSTGLQFTEVYEENELTRSSELVGYAVAKGECTDTEVIVPQVYNGLPVVQVADWGFGESNITKIVLPSTIKIIKGGAFYNCSNLIDVNLPSGLTTICEQAFYRCTNLALTFLPDSIESIGDWAFDGGNGLYLTKLPKSLKNVGLQAFMNCNLKLERLPEFLEVMGDRAFSESGIIKNINISERCISIGEGVFYRVETNSIVVDSNNPIYNDGDGSNCLIETSSKKLIKACASTIIPTSSDIVTSMSDSAFVGAYGLYSIVIPANIESVNYAFSESYKLVQVRNLSGCELLNFPTPVGCQILTDEETEFTNKLEVNEDGWEIFTDENDEKYLFGYKGEAFSGNIPVIEGVNQIYAYAFYNNDKINTTIIPNTINHMGSAAFGNCVNIIQITIPEGVSNLYWGMFMGCINLETVNLPSTINTIDALSFWDCINLKNINLPDGLNSLGGSVFSNCNSLTNVILPNNLTYIEMHCFSDSMLSIDGNYKYIPFRDGTWYLAGYTDADVINLSLSSNISWIGGSAFNNFAHKLETIEIPESVKYIDSYAFMSCESLKDINLPDSLISLGYQAFYGCESLLTITIPESISNIQFYTFANCSNLKKVVINNINSWISSDAFISTPNLNGIIVNSNEAYINESFNNITKEIYFNGTKEQWDTLEGSEYITKTIHFYKEGCLHSDEGYWQYNEQGFPIIGMSVEEVVKQAPTCEATGSKDIVCIHCDEVVSANIVIPKVPHNFVDGTCSECETAINYTITQGDPYGFEYFKGEYDTLYWNLNRYVDSSTSTLTLTASVDVIVTFEYWVDAGFGDYFALLKDSIEILQVENTNYQFIKYSVTLSAGEVLTFSYVKDAADSWNNDQLQIKDLTVADV